MTRREAAKQLIQLYADAIAQGFDDDQEGTAAEVVAVAVYSLLKEEDNDA